MSSCYVVVFSKSIEEHRNFGSKVDRTSEDDSKPTMVGCTTTGYGTNSLPALLAALGKNISNLARSNALSGRNQSESSSEGIIELDKYPRDVDITVCLKAGWQGFVLTFASMEYAEAWMNEATRDSSGETIWFAIPMTS